MRGAVPAFASYLLVVCVWTGGLISCSNGQIEAEKSDDNVTLITRREISSSSHIARRVVRIRHSANHRRKTSNSILLDSAHESGIYDSAQADDVDPEINDVNQDEHSFLTVFEKNSSNHSGNDVNDVRFPVMFATTSAYLITKFKLYSTFSIHFKIRTTQPNGLIFFSGSASPGRDFMAVELFQGHLRYIFDVGSGPRIIHDRLQHQKQHQGHQGHQWHQQGHDQFRMLNDNTWHEVFILRPSVNQHILRVDDAVSVDSLPDSRSVHYDLPDDDLFMGGLSKQMFASGQLPKQIRSQVGFQGCLASIDLNEVRWRLLESKAEIAEEHRDNIREGCIGPTSQCHVSTCLNGGICIQQWTSHTCDCDMTSYVGSKCDKEGVSYTFGESGGVIALTLPQHERRDSQSDKIAFGFRTRKSDAVILRLGSLISSDFIEVELTNGFVGVVYNMGKTGHRVTEGRHKVDEDDFHVVQFTRNGQNSSLKVDEFPAQRKNPLGRQLSTFNQQSVIFVGGARNLGAKGSTGRSTKSFQGTISGLVINGLKVLELTVKQDRRVKIEGNVHLDITSRRSIPPIPSKPVSNKVDQFPPNSVVEIVDSLPHETVQTSDDSKSDETSSGCKGDDEDISCTDDDEDEVAEGKADNSNVVRVKELKEISTRLSYVGEFGEAKSYGGTKLYGQVLLKKTPKRDQPCDSAKDNNNSDEDYDDCQLLSSPSSSSSSSSHPVVNKPHRISFSTNQPTSVLPLSSLRTDHVTTTADGRAGPFFGSSIFPIHIGRQNRVTDRHLSLRSSTFRSRVDPANKLQYPTPGFPEERSGSAKTPGEIRGRRKGLLDRSNTFEVNIGLIVGTIAGLLAIFVILVFVACKFRRRREERSLKLDTAASKDKMFKYESSYVVSKSIKDSEVSKSCENAPRTKKKPVKEWYV